MKEVKNPVGRPRKTVTSQEIVIEKNVPFRSKYSNLPCNKYPFKKMKVGDSFYFEGVHRTTVYHYAKVFAKTNNLKWRFATRQEKTGHRIWRIS